MKDVTVTVSGSFHRHIDRIMEAVEEFRSRHVKVLSPEDPRIVDSVGTFLFVASDKHRSIRLVQDRHLAAISQSSFLWLVSPDGYVGQSASLELGFAIAYGVPIFGQHVPPDLTLREYIQQVKNMDEAIRLARVCAAHRPLFEGSPSLLVDPPSVIKEAHDRLEIVDQTLRAPRDLGEEDIAHRISTHLQAIRRATSLPTLGVGSVDGVP